MDIEREDLVGFALNALDPEESARVAAAVAADPALKRELKEIERHVRLQEQMPRIAPPPALFESIRSRLDEPAAVRRPLLRRFWMPAAAAALIALAFLAPRGTSGPRFERVHGDVVRQPDGSYASQSVCRIRTTDGVLLTLDANTNFRLETDQRLALSAGRVFLEVPPERSGFQVIAEDLVAVTTGTAFLVDAGSPAYVWTESGHVRCSWRGREGVAGPGDAFFASNTPPPPRPPSPRAWFQRPSLSAQVLDETTVRVILRNDMPDPIEVAPSKSGEPLFFVRYLGHDFPLAPDDFKTLKLAPLETKSFDLRLPRPLPGEEALVVSYAPGGASAVARR